MCIEWLQHFDTSVYPDVMDKTAQRDSGIKLAKDVSEQLSARRSAVETLRNTELTDRRLHTQSVLLDAGRLMIAERGVAGTSVGDLTKAAGFTRGAFYSNFTDMDHFVAEVAQLEWHAMFADVQRVLDTWEFTAQDPIEGATGVLLAALPSERTRYLLWNEFATFEIRFPQESATLSKSSRGFYSGLVQLLTLVLETFELEPRHEPADLVELIVALAQRSMRNELVLAHSAGPTPASTPPQGGTNTLLARLLPDLIRAMTVPKPEQ